jgi:23S rRNA (uracil1939-C5)-methyltransferase
MSTGSDDTVDLTIERVGARGDGIADYRGKPVFVAFTAPGDRVRARLGPKRDEGRIGEVVKLVAPGARQTPVCPHFGACGGCALQHLADDAYVAMKEDQVRSALAHRGLDPSVVQHLRRLPGGIRRRARLALHRPRKGAPQVGFHGRESREIVDMRVCAVLHPALVAQVAPLRALGAALLQPDDRGAATLTQVDGGVDLLLDVPRAPDLAGLEALAAFAHAHDLARLSWRADETDIPTPVIQRRPARVVFSGIAVDVPPDSFLQASAEADSVLTELVLGGVGSFERVADLYAGLGTFTFPLAARASVHAVDGSRSAVAALVAAAARAGIAARVTAEARDLAVRPLAPDELRSFDAVVFDPPRAGAKSQARSLADSRVPRIVAVSCDPATFARDARALVDGGYRLMRVVPVDQFIWSPHVELVALLERGR